jgi:hypothetical protein
MQTFSEVTPLSEERRARMALNRQKILETKLATLEAKTHPLKLKELRERFPFAEFHMTTEKNLCYKIDFNRAGVDWMPEMLWFKDYYTSYPFYYFPRSYKIEITTGGIKKDISHLF